MIPFCSQDGAFGITLPKQLLCKRSAVLGAPRQTHSATWGQELGTPQGWGPQPSVQPLKQAEFQSAH